MTLTCEYGSHADDQTTCGGTAVVALTVYESDGEPWEWGTQRLCATAYSALVNGFVFYPYGLTPADAEVVVTTIFDDAGQDDAAEMVCEDCGHTMIHHAFFPAADPHMLGEPAPFCSAAYKPEDSALIDHSCECEGFVLYPKA